MANSILPIGWKQICSCNFQRQFTRDSLLISTLEITQGDHDRTNGLHVLVEKR